MKGRDRDGEIGTRGGEEWREREEREGGREREGKGGRGR